MQSRLTFQIYLREDFVRISPSIHDISIKFLLQKNVHGVLILIGTSTYIIYKYRSAKKSTQQGTVSSLSKIASMGVVAIVTCANGTPAGMSFEHSFHSSHKE